MNFGRRRSSYTHISTIHTHFFCSLLSISFDYVHFGNDVCARLCCCATKTILRIWEEFGRTLPAYATFYYSLKSQKLIFLVRRLWSLKLWRLSNARRSGGCCAHIEIWIVCLATTTISCTLRFIFHRIWIICVVCGYLWSFFDRKFIPEYLSRAMEISPQF